MVTLVCEGACNPGTEAWKRWRDGVHRRMVASKGELGWPDDIARRWVHTPHTPIGKWYRCTVCGEARRWGS